MRNLNEIASGVAHLRVSIANVYFIGRPGGPWALVDTSVPGSASKIRQAAEARYGRNARPEAILLTHGHYDHSGSALDLASLWDVRVYAHPLELPYLTGKSAYPDPDRTAPGFLSFLSRFFLPRTLDLEGRVRSLNTDSQVPGLSGWEWHHTPGHAPGHVSFFRRSDGTLIAGDALATVNLDKLFHIVTSKQQICRPPTPFTCDWKTAHESVKFLARLRPYTVAAGHGVPMVGREVAAELSKFATNFPMPEHGRYVSEGARTDASGVVSLPPAPTDPVFGIAAAVGVVAVAGTMFAVAARRRKRRNGDAILGSGSGSPSITSIP